MKTPLKKLRRLIRYHFSTFLMKRNFLKVFLLQIQLNPAFYESVSFQLFRGAFQVLERVVEDGKKEGSFSVCVSSRIFRNLFLGAFSHMALRWFIANHSGKSDMMKEIDELADLLTKAVLPKGAKYTGSMG